MFYEFRAPDWETYRMDYHSPHRELEPLEREIAVVDEALQALEEVGVLSSTSYDHDLMLAHRRAVRDTFVIPWTGITPRMQRLLYAINAIARPQVMIGAGIFCGFTFINNAGAAVGPGACYQAQDLVGVEIDQEMAAVAQGNLRRVTSSPVARIVAADALEVLAEYPGEINLLYLDADGPAGVGKGIYLDLLRAAYDKMPPGSLVLAHNSVNCARSMAPYLDFVRDDANLTLSINLIPDGEGLEVSLR